MQSHFFALIFVFTIRDIWLLPISPCNRLYLRGLDDDTRSPWISYAGVYRHSKPVSGISTSLVYRHEKYAKVQFLYRSSDGQFVVTDGTEVIRAHTNGRNPQPFSSNPFNEMITDWMSYNLYTHSFQSIGQSAIQPTCVDEDFFQCDSGHVEFNYAIQVISTNKVLIKLHRFSQKEGLYSNLRPVFSADAGLTVIYLYHLDNSWIIGQNYQSTQALARSYDTALRPEFIMNDWYVLENSLTWVLKENLTIQCTGLDDNQGCDSLKQTVCLNGGTCKLTSEGRSYCLCAPNYYGMNCEKIKSACPNFSDSFPFLKAWHRNLNSNDGSITVWFCSTKVIPNQGFSVCQHDKWSVSAICKKGGNGVSDLRVLTFVYVHYTKILILLIVMCVGQVFFPCLLFGTLNVYRAFCPKSEQSQAKQKAQIIAQFRQELTIFEKRYQTSILPQVEYSDEANAELADIQQRLEKAVDTLKAKQRKNKRKRRDTAAGCGQVTFYYDSFTIWFWIAYLAISYWYDFAFYIFAFQLFNGFAITWLVLLTLFVIIESAMSSECQYIKNLSTVSSTKNRIESILETPPTITMVAECYHYEKRGRNSTKMKVVSATITEPNVFHYWRNQSPSTLLDLHTQKVTKIKLNVDIEFGDRESAIHFDKCYSHFQELNCDHDEEVKFIVLRQVPGFVKRMTTHNGSRPVWMNYLFYFLSIFLCVGWLYRIIFNRVTRRTEYKMTKLVYLHRPAFSNVLRYSVSGAGTLPIGGNDYPHPLMTINENDTDSSLPPPPAYDTLYNIDNINSILETLEKESSDLCDIIIPSTLTAKNSKYVNVKLDVNDKIQAV